MVKKIIYFCCTGAFFVSFATAQNDAPEELFDRANSLYHSKKFPEAVALYQQLINRDYVSAELFYNLGNAYFKLNRLGYAIYYYEKARQLDPNDEDVQFNLQLSEIRLKDKIITPPDFFVYEYAKAFIHILSKTAWAFLTLAFLYVFIASLGMRKFMPQGLLWRLSKMVLTIACSLFFCFGAILGMRIYSDHMNKEAIILSATAEIKSEPDPGSLTVFILHEGSKVSIRTDRDLWYEIKLKDGKIGWVKYDELGLL
jgi:tetratricopeptide (TPR) repeat protein